MARTVESAFNTTLAQSLKSSGSDTEIKLAGLPLTITSGVMKIGSGTNVEWVYFGTVDAGSSEIRTCVRGLKKNASSTSDALSANKKNFAVGDPVKLVYHSVAINQVAYLDIDNIFTGANAFSLSLKVPVYANATARDAAIPAPANGMVIYNTAVGLLQKYLAGAWVDDTAGGTVANGTETVAGKWEGATVAEQGAATATGATGANLVPMNKNLVKSSSGAGDENKIPVLGASGKLAAGFIPDMAVVVTGSILAYSMNTAPSGYLLCDGSAVSRVTYATLFALLNPTIGTFTVSIASPGLVTLNSHGLQTGDAVYLTTTGALPTGLSVNTRYWVVRNDANSFWLATSLANALAGTKITTSGSQSGTHTATQCPYGVGDGSTTFNVPNISGKVVVHKNTSDSEFAGLGQTGGEKTHTLTETEMPAHIHTINGNTLSGSGGGAGTILTGFGTVNNAAELFTSGGVKPIQSTGGNGAHNNLQPYITLNYIIKT